MDQDNARNWEVAVGAGQARLLMTLERLLAIRATDVKGALDEASEIVAQAMGVDKVDAFIYDPSAETLVALGTSATPMGRRQHAIGLDRLPVANGGRLVEVFRSGVPFRTGRSDEDPEELRGVKEGLGVRSTLAAPIEIDGERRGLFSIVSAQPDAFGEEDLRFCEATARWVALILHRAELAEQVVRETAAQVRRVAAEELIEVLAHDLKTPLTPMRGYVDLLRSFAEREGRARDVGYATQVSAGLERLQRMIDDLMDVNRLELSLFALLLQPVDLAELVRRTADVLEAPNAPIVVRAPDDLVVSADADRLRQALENLIGNALAHGPGGAPVAVQVDREERTGGPWAVVRVRDAGPGIAPELLPTLFERFARGAGSTGLGLGLYLARGIAEAHGGTLTVESTPGQGTTFHLALPEDPGA
jgi:signal transduction histidine kinase